MMAVNIYGATALIGTIHLDVRPAHALKAARYFKDNGFQVEVDAGMLYVRQPRRVDGKCAGMALRKRFKSAHKYFDGTISAKGLAEFMGRVAKAGL